MNPFSRITTLARSKEYLKGVLIDLIALAVIFFTPVLAHLANIPFYMIEPMRLMVMISIAHSTRVNSYILAFTLSLFSYAVSGHPEPVKMLVMTIEMVANVFLFYLLLRKLNNVFFSMVAAIITSKILCYTLYLIFFSLIFLLEEAGTVFLIAQIITTMLFSAYVSWFYKKKITD